MPKESFIIVMPTYNEEGCIDKVVSSWMEIVQQFPDSEMLILNDGSTDDTGQKLDKLTKKYPALKVIHKNNEGHGKTLIKGYSEAVINTFHNWVFQTDSDNQFSPQDFNKLWQFRTKSDFILGRRKNRQDPYYRVFLSSILRCYLGFLFGKNIRDANIPFRLINKTYLKNILRKVPKDVFAPNIFLSVLAAQDNLDLINIPVTHRSRTFGISTLHFWKYVKSGLRVAKELFCFRLSLKP